MAPLPGSSKGRPIRLGMTCLGPLTPWTGPISPCSLVLVHPLCSRSHPHQAWTQHYLSYHPKPTNYFLFSILTLQLSLKKGAPLFFPKSRLPLSKEPISNIFLSPLHPFFSLEDYWIFYILLATNKIWIKTWANAWINFHHLDFGLVKSLLRLVYMRFFFYDFTCDLSWFPFIWCWFFMPFGLVEQIDLW